jgi:hypothetical protein
VRNKTIGNQHAGALVQCGPRDCDETDGVEHGAVTEQDRAGVDCRDGSEIQRRIERVLTRDHHTFGAAGCAGGVEKDARGVHFRLCRRRAVDGGPCASKFGQGRNWRGRAGKGGGLARKVVEFGLGQD